jgi:uncharacterized membrane protein
MKHPLIILALLASVTFYACSDDDTTPTKEDDPPVEVSFCDSVDATYDKNIAAIIGTNCATSGCHEDNSGAPKGIRLATYAQVKAAAEGGKFLKAIKREAGVTAMPIGKAKLAADTIKVIECWIDNGYKEN